MDIADKIELFKKFPGAFSQLLKDRCGVIADEDQLAQFILEVIEDNYYVRDGKLWATDRSSYTIEWCPNLATWETV